MAFFGTGRLQTELDEKGCWNCGASENRALEFCALEGTAMPMTADIKANIKMFLSNEPSLCFVKQSFADKFAQKEDRLKIF